MVVLKLRRGRSWDYHMKKEKSVKRSKIWPYKWILTTTNNKLLLIVSKLSFMPKEFAILHTPNNGRSNSLHMKNYPLVIYLGVRLLYISNAMQFVKSLNVMLEKQLYFNLHLES